MKNFESYNEPEIEFVEVLLFDFTKARPEALGRYMEELNYSSFDTPKDTYGLTVDTIAHCIYIIAKSYKHYLENLLALPVPEFWHFNAIDLIVRNHQEFLTMEESLKNKDSSMLNVNEAKRQSIYLTIVQALAFSSKTNKEDKAIFLSILHSIYPYSSTLSHYNVVVMLYRSEHFCYKVLDEMHCANSALVCMAASKDLVRFWRDSDIHLSVFEELYVKILNRIHSGSLLSKAIKRSVKDLNMPECTFQAFIGLIKIKKSLGLINYKSDRSIKKRYKKLKANRVSILNIRGLSKEKKGIIKNISEGEDGDSKILKYMIYTSITIALDATVKVKIDPLIYNSPSRSADKISIRYYMNLLCSSHKGSTNFDKRFSSLFLAERKANRKYLMVKTIKLERKLNKKHRT